MKPSGASRNNRGGRSVGSSCCSRRARAVDLAAPPNVLLWQPPSETLALWDPESSPAVARTSKTAKLRRPDVSTLTVRPLQEDDWPTIEQLFGPNGACGGCWCMWWRVPQGGKLWDRMKGTKNRDAFRKLVEDGEVHAVIAFRGEEPVGWCSFGPRRSYPRLERVRALRRDWPEDTWSILCFYIPTAWRRRGVARLLLKAATARAFKLGAREIEGYPVVTSDSTGMMPAAFAWTGVPALFEAAGYKALHNQDGRRRVFVKAPARSASKSGAGRRPGGPPGARRSGGSLERHDAESAR
jgi:GNAT superfamily N-acetyltransferase